MKVLFDARMKSNSGIGVYIRNILKEIPEHDINFEIIEKSSPNPKLNCRSNAYSPLEQLRKYQISSSFQGIPLWTPHFNISMFSKSPQVATIHDCFHLAHKRHISPLHYHYAKILFNAVKNKCDKIITDSAFTATELTRLTEIPLSKIEVVHLGVGEDFFNKASIQIDIKKPFIHFIGNLKPNKNLIRLLRAFKSILNEIPHDLIIIGQREGFRTRSLDYQMIEKEFQGRVFFTGKVSTEELKWFNENSSALVLPSTYEGFGLPPLESAALGCPILCSNTNSLGEIYSEIAVTFNPYNEDEIANALRSLKDEKNFPSKSDLISFAKGFSWKRTAKTTAEIIKDL